MMDTNYDAGYATYLSGSPESDNPHLPEDCLSLDFPNPESESWAVGWRQAREDEGRRKTLAAKPSMRELAQSMQTLRDHLHFGWGLPPGNFLDELKQVVDVLSMTNGEWLDIADAPKDGTSVLVWNGVPWIANFIEESGSWNDDHEAQIGEVTHWQPLPQPPKP